MTSPDVREFKPLRRREVQRMPEVLARLREIPKLWRGGLQVAPVPVRCEGGRHVLRTARLVLHTPRDFLDMEIGLAAGADADAQHWLGASDRLVVDAATAEHLLGIDDHNRVERLSSFPAAMRRGLTRPLPPGPIAWLLAVDVETGRAAGLSSLTPDGEIGLRLAPTHRGRGLGTELVEATTRLGHAHRGLQTVRAGTERSNDRCRRALSAAGFVPCEGPSQHTLADGRVTDAVWYQHEAKESESLGPRRDPGVV
ncbi:GNAT family N-acetyltransferase [Streptomyces sp. NPDC029216]|uniref:GNAT family N-acetyltransferase n=1 Tax=Streptomyces sp. NPDC029216 TaxID=3154701 RepID=UPI00340A4057